MDLIKRDSSFQYDFFTHKESFSNEINVRTYPIWNSHFLQKRNILLKREQFEQNELHYINDLLTNLGKLRGYNDFQTLIE